MTGEFAEAIRRGATEHAEIETYTFDVLPAELRTGGVTESIAGEYAWVMKHVFDQRA